MQYINGKNSGERCMDFEEMVSNRSKKLSDRKNMRNSLHTLFFYLSGVNEAKYAS